MTNLDFQSGEDESGPARIEEESDSPQDEQKKSIPHQKSVIFDIVSLRSKHRWSKWIF